MLNKRETERERIEREFRVFASDLYLHVDVLGEGPTNAEVLIIGEGPGQQEVKTGSPFTGGAGRMLWDTLRSINLSRANCYVTNVVKRQVSLSRKGNEKHVVHRDELDKWIGLLHWEIEQLPNVKTILVLGNYALEAIQGHQGITNWRGSVIDGYITKDRPVKIVITINPAYAIRELKQEPMFKMDVMKLGKVLRGEFNAYRFEPIINPSYAQVRRFIRDVKRARKPTAFDIEVINMETACYGLANDAHTGMCINLRDHVSNRFTVQQEADILLDLQDLFKEFKLNSIPLIAQNGMFDAYWVWYKDYLKFHCTHDTLLAHHTLYPQWPHNLGFLTSQYTNLPFYKDEGKRWKEGGDIDDFWRYNVKDCCVLIPIHKRQQRDLQSEGLAEFFHNHVMRLQPYCIAATVHGVAVDMEAKQAAIEGSARDLAQHEEEVYRFIREASGDEEFKINLQSWQQMQHLMFKVLGLEGRGTSTDKSNRERIRKNPRTPAIAKELLVAYDRYQEESKYHNSFATARVSDDDRFRFELKQYGVVKAPGRLSSKQLLTGEGGNIQNQPPRARHMYVADPDCCFIYFDLAQAEARVVAYRANIEKWKEQFERARLDGSYDCHRALASEMFHIPYDEVPKKDTYQDEEGHLHYTQRYVAKRCRHGLNYRMEVDKLAEVTGLAYHDARVAYQLYHRLTPELKRWWKQAERDFRESKIMYNALGRRLKVIQRLDEKVLESIIAFYPQSTIGDKVTQVWYQSMEDRRWPRSARIAINVHDSLIGIAKPSEAKRALSIMKKYAETPLMIQDAWKNKPEPLIIPAETKMSVLSEGKHRWSHMVDVEV